MRASTSATRRSTSGLQRAVAGFGMLLRNSPYKGNLTYAAVIELAQPAPRHDPYDTRKEFCRLVLKASQIAPTSALSQSARAAGARGNDWPRVRKKELGHGWRRKN